MRVRNIFSMLAMASATVLAACQLGANTDQLAVLDSADAETVETLKAALADAVGRANIELGPGDLTQSSTISVLPPPLGEFETHSLAKPTLFDLSKKGKTCLLTRQDTGDVFALEGVSCRIPGG